MFDKLFRTTSVMPVPDNLRELIEKELFDFLYSFQYSFGIKVALFLKSSSGDQKILLQSEINIKKIRTSIDNLERLWPAGKTAIGFLKKFESAMSDDLKNMRSWSRILFDNVERSNELDQKSLQQCVLRGRQLADQINNSINSALEVFRNAKIDVDQIASQSLEHLKPELDQW